MIKTLKVERCTDGLFSDTYCVFVKNLRGEMLSLIVNKINITGDGRLEVRVLCKLGDVYKVRVPCLLGFVTEVNVSASQLD